MDDMMPSRFTVTEKWEDLWFRKLSPNAKLLFMYICDKCDIAGFWPIDLELAAFTTGIPAADIEKVFKELDKSYVRVTEGLVWVKNFIIHQGNWPLNESVPAHRGITKKLLSHKDFIDKALQYLSEKTGITLTKGLPNPLSISISKSKRISKSISKEQNEQFNKFWQLYPRKVGKGAAQKAWLKINPSEELVEKIAVAIDQQRKVKQWQDPQFIPYPATWLNEKRWDDVPILPKSIHPDRFCFRCGKPAQIHIDQENKDWCGGDCHRKAEEEHLI